MADVEKPRSDFRRAFAGAEYLIRHLTRSTEDVGTSANFHTA